MFGRKLLRLFATKARSRAAPAAPRRDNIYEYYEELLRSRKQELGSPVHLQVSEAQLRRMYQLWANKRGQRPGVRERQDRLLQLPRQLQRLRAL